MAGLTGLTGLSSLASALPKRAVLTDDPMRAKMLVAHWLDNADLLFELRGMVGYTGKYKGAEIALLSAGFGETSAKLYMHDAALLGAGRFVYMGECVSRVPGYRLRDVIVPSGGDEALAKCALEASAQASIPIVVRDVATCDSYFLRESQAPGELIDFASAAVAEIAAELGLAAISILTVSQNTALGERVEEHERQSRFHDAARLCFETLALDAEA